jgi:predicted MFS family arabinose efflux permease
MRLILILLAALNFTHILDFMILMPLGNYLMPYFGISPQAFSLLVSAYTISAAISGFGAAFFVDRYDRKKVLLLAYTGFLLGTVACGLAPVYEALLAARIVAGLFGGMIGAQVLSIVADTIPYERRGAAMGVVMSAFAIASTFGVPFALYLSNLLSWHAPFFFVASVGALLLPLLMRYLPSVTKHLEQSEVPRSRMTIIQDVLSNKDQYNALIFSGLIMFGHFVIIPFINPYMEFNVGFSRTITPLIYLTGGVCSFLASNILGRVADRYGKLNVFIWCTLGALPLILTITHLPPLQWYGPVLVLFGVWFIMATGRGVAAGALISQVVVPAQRGSFQSFNSSVQQLGTGLASLLAGFIVSKDAGTGRLVHFNAAGYISVAALAICVWLSRRIFKKA